MTTEEFNEKRIVTEEEIFALTFEQMDTIANGPARKRSYDISDETRRKLSEAAVKRFAKARKEKRLAK